MKKVIYLSILICLSIVGCQKDESNSNAEVDAPEVIYAHTEGDMTKTTVSNDGTKCSILWSAGDKIARFATDGTVRRYTLNTGEGQKDATFKGDGGTPGSISTLSAYLAYTSMPIDGGVNDQITCVETDGNFTVSHDHTTLSSQKYAENAFDYRAFPMVAVSDDGNDFSFKNVCGGILLKLKGTSKMDKIIIKGLDDETISGAYTVTASKDNDPYISLTGEGKTITMDCCDRQLDETATDFYVSVPPTPFESGFSVTLTDTDGFSRTYNSKAGKSSIGRSEILNMPEITFPVKEFDLTDDLAVGGGASYDKETQVLTFTGSSNRYVDFSVTGIDLTKCKGIGIVTDDCNFNVKFAFYEKGKYSSTVGSKEWLCSTPGNQSSKYVRSYDFPDWLIQEITKEGEPAVVDRIRLGLNSFTGDSGNPAIHLVRFILY